jgi:biotin--protein ligase
VQILDGNNKPHTLQVQVLGAEETWHTPSLLLATVSNGDGKVVFSQVHLEVDPTQYEDEESKFMALKESNTARLEIIQDLLSTHLGLECAADQKLPTYTPGYFLGRHEVGVCFVSGNWSSRNVAIFTCIILPCPCFCYLFFLPLFSSYTSPFPTLCSS